MKFAERYGAWALIAGASEGTGRAFAKQVAAAGVNCILVARREEPLERLAEEIRRECEVECITAAVDLAAADACSRLIDTVGERELGLLIWNAGADPYGSHFLDCELQAWDELVQRNVVAMMRCCHHFAAPMRDRNRGGILLVNSGACYGGSAFMAAYSASKAFTLCFAESLWGELRTFGVDVLTLVMHVTDTPALRTLLAERELPLPAGMATPEAVASLGLTRLRDGPVQNWGLADDDAGYALTSASDRRQRVIAIGAASARVFGGRRDGSGGQLNGEVQNGQQ